MASEQKRQSERQESMAIERSGGGERGLATRQYQDPFAAVDALFERLQQNLFGTRLFNTLWPMHSGQMTAGSAIRMPRMQMHDAGDAVELTAEMPGIEPSNVSVNIEGELLTISGEHRAQDEREGVRSERYSSFYRQIGLPEAVDTEQAQASYKNGMLTVRFPKARSNARKIDVAIEGGQQQTQAKERAA